MDVRPRRGAERIDDECNDQPERQPDHPERRVVHRLAHTESGDDRSGADEDENGCSHELGRTAADQTARHGTSIKLQDSR